MGIRTNTHYQGSCCEWCDDLSQGRAIGNIPPEGMLNGYKCADWMCSDPTMCAGKGAGRLTTFPSLTPPALYEDFSGEGLWFQQTGGSTTEVLGCTDTTATNYNDQATDGNAEAANCIFPAKFTAGDIIAYKICPTCPPGVPATSCPCAEGAGQVKQVIGEDRWDATTPVMYETQWFRGDKKGTLSQMTGDNLEFGVLLPGETVSKSIQPQCITTPCLPIVSTGIVQSMDPLTTGTTLPRDRKYVIQWDNGQTTIELGTQINATGIAPPVIQTPPISPQPPQPPFYPPIGQPIGGCMNTMASNYNPNADMNISSMCIFPQKKDPGVVECTDKEYKIGDNCIDKSMILIGGAVALYLLMNKEK